MRINNTELCECLINDMTDVCDELKRTGNQDDYQLGRWLQDLTDKECANAVDDALAPIRVDKMEYGDSYSELSYAVRGWYNELDEVVEYLTTTVGRINKKTVISIIKAIMTDINNYV